MKRCLTFETKIQKIYSFSSFWKWRVLKNTVCFKIHLSNLLQGMDDHNYSHIYSTNALVRRWKILMMRKRILGIMPLLQELNKCWFSLERHCIKEQTLWRSGLIPAFTLLSFAHICNLFNCPKPPFSLLKMENSEVPCVKALSQNLAHTSSDNPGIAIITLQLLLGGNDL